MNFSKKGFFGIVLIVALLTSAFAYAITAYWNIASDVDVGTFGVEVYKWASDAPAFGDLKTTHSWNKVWVDETQTSENLAIWNIGELDATIKYTEDLADDIGLTPQWEIEVYDGSWDVWYTVFPDGTIEYEGSPVALPNLGPDDPANLDDCFGFRSDTPTNFATDKILTSLGHLIMTLTSVSPISGTYSYTMTVIGEGTAPP